jgi:hypothetical protein
MKMWIVAWVVLSLVFAGVFSGQFRDYYHIYRAGRSTTGVVLARSAHESVQYSFEVDGREFRGISRPQQPNPAFRELSAGNKIQVYFDPGDPTINCVGDPKLLLKNEAVFVGWRRLCFLLLP